MKNIISKTKIKTCENMYRTLKSAMLVFQYIAENFDEYTPFTKNNNEDIFLILKTKFETKYRNQTKIKVTREYFERSIFNQHKLEDFYVEEYSKEPVFYIYLTTIHGQDYEFYVMADKIILLIFFKKTKG